MGGSYVVGNTVSCNCEVPGADDDLCIHYFDELDFSSFDINGEDDDGLTDLSQEIIFHDVDENESIFDGNGSDGSDCLSNDLESNEGLTCDDRVLRPSEEGETLTGTTKGEEDLTGTDSCNTECSAAEPRRLRSAIKGSRAKEGIVTESGRRIKWAPDVYDPPVTSDDHTLKKVLYKPRSKHIKKEHYYYSHKYKYYSKSKSSQQGKSRSQHNGKSSSQKIDQRALRSQGRQGKAPMANLAAPKKHVNNANNKATTSEKKELKFGASFCREPVNPTVHISLAEAS